MTEFTKEEEKNKKHGRQEEREGNLICVNGLPDQK